MAYRVNMVPTVRSTSFCRLAPMNWAIMMVPPTARPLIRLMMRMVTWPPMPTAEAPTAPPNCPTMTISAILYRACSKLDSRKGTENFSSCPNTLPCVRSV